jgi:hypothetical protein
LVVAAKRIACMESSPCVCPRVGLTIGDYEQSVFGLAWLE